MYTTDDNDSLTNRFHFQCVDCNGDTITVNFKAFTLSEVLQKFEQFVKGCGYVLPEGTHIDTVSDEW
jgi:hypothetical protein